MSVFEPAPICEICHQNTGQKIVGGYSSRCAYCKDRFDKTGEPFIVYCDIVSFACGDQKMSRLKMVHLLHFWMMDGVVVKAPYGFSGMMGMSLDDLCQSMREINYEKIEMT